MREIKFRAKRIDNGEWAESASVSKSKKLFGEVLWFIGAGQPAEQWVDDRGNLIAVSTTGECLFYACDPKTLGQFTGLTDKNGKKIFEDDIGKSIDGVFLVRWSEEKCAFVLDFYNYPKEELYIEEMWDDAEVIGNIHDNPEFLRGEEDG